MSDIATGVHVHRAYALDTARHLSVLGRYPKFLALPDRWWTWYWAGSRAAMSLARKRRFDLIWSTYPIPTAHRIASRVARNTGIPWVADFRDSMVDQWFPGEPARRKWHESIEADTVRHARALVVTAPSTKELYRSRYPGLGEENVVCIPNGYDESILAEVESAAPAYPGPGARIKLLHSGILYPVERDPSSLFQALASLKRSGTIDADSLRVVFRGSRYDDRYRPVLARLEIDDIVSLEPGVDYREALKEMYASDGLLLMQSATCNHQIPAKVYEYSRVGRPLLALTDAGGDTAGYLETASYGHVVALDDAEEIARGLTRFIESIRRGDTRAPRREVVEKYSRKALSDKLANTLDAALD
jgi:glycosyltransferase involved in cell wall biosynthesis